MIAIMNMIHQPQGRLENSNVGNEDDQLGSDSSKKREKHTREKP